MLRSRNYRAPVPARGVAGALLWLVAPAAVTLAVVATLLAAGRPGVVFERRALRAVPGVPTDTGQTFLVGFAEYGPGPGHVSAVDGKAWQRLGSFGDYQRVYGGRDGVYAALSDSVEAAFAEGASVVYVARVLGAAPVKASLVLSDGTGTAMTITALYPGAFGNRVSVAVTGVADGEFDLEVLVDDIVVETFRDNVTVAAAVAALAGSDWVRGTAGTGVDPVAAAAADLAGGTDDTAGASDATWAAAVDTFAYELGPGQVAAPGRTTTAAWEDLCDHAAARNRVALLDSPNAASKATLLVAAAALGEYTHAEFGLHVGNRVTVPQAVAGVDRVVPASAVAAGLIARNDATADAGVWPIGDRGRLRYALAATSEFSDADRADLTAAGVNVFLDDPNGLRLYGYRTASADPLHANFGSERLMMAYEAQVRRLAETFVGRRITAAAITDYHQGVEGIAMGYWAAGALFGDTAADAFRVVTADPVNTAATALARELNSESYLRMSESAELVRHVSTVVPVTSPVAA